MAFSAPETLERRMRRAGRDDYATIEIGHPESKIGIVVRVEILRSPGGLRELIAEAMELAASYPATIRRPTDPGWWAGVVCTAAAQMGYPAAVLRGTSARSRLHACMVVERGGMLDAWPDWPRVRVGLGALEDLRGEKACAVGPSDSDLSAYARREGIESDPATLRRMFDMGVLEWDTAHDAESGRRMIRAAR